MPTQFLGVLLHTIAIYGLSHVRTELLPLLVVSCEKHVVPNGLKMMGDRHGWRTW